MYYAHLFAEDKDEFSILSVVLKQAGMIAKPLWDIETIFASGNDTSIQMVIIAVPSEEVLQQVVSLMQKPISQPLLLITDPLPERIQCQLLDKSVDMIIDRPYSSRLLLSQVRALLRRADTIPTIHLPPLNFEGLMIDPATRSVRSDKHPTQRLTHLEFRLLYTLMVYRGQVVPTDKIVEAVWGYSGQGDRELVRGLISRLRSKLETNPQHPAFILTVPGIGYLFDGTEK